MTSLTLTKGLTTIEYHPVVHWMNGDVSRAFLIRSVNHGTGTFQQYIGTQTAHKEVDALIGTGYESEGALPY